MNITLYEKEQPQNITQTIDKETEQPKEETNNTEDIINSYILPICPNIDTTSDLYKKALMTLSFMLMCKRDNVFMTRSGAKEKDNQFSNKSDAWNNLQNLATDCHFVIEELKKVEGANEKPKVIDICGIYFKTNFYHI